MVPGFNIKQSVLKNRLPSIAWDVTLDYTVTGRDKPLTTGSGHHDFLYKVSLKQGDRNCSRNKQEHNICHYQIKA